MNIFKNLLYLNGDLRDAPFAEPPRSYAEGYGNKVAARRAFPPLRGMPPAQAREPGREKGTLPLVPAPCGCG